MECPYCKAMNRNGTQYCSSCGKRIASNPASGPSSSGGNASGAGASNPLNATNAGALSGSSSSLTTGSRLQGGRYVVKRVLGQGGMGAALLATDLRLDGKLVVIKELISASSDPTRLQEDVRNFKREVSMLAHIDHPLVPSVTDHFQEGTRYFMVQEYVEGENLEARLDQTNQPLREREALICASELLDVLEYLAQQTPPIVHRDIKPANIIVGTRDRKAHLVDFGIAREDSARNQRRKQTSALGTPGYAPPEQYQGNADPRSDVYALAATLHHVLTNRDPRNHPPFNFPPVRMLNPQISPETERVLQRALNNDINQRYQSATLMKQEVDTILHQRFGLAGNIDSYTMGSMSGIGGNSGAMPTLPAQGPDATLLPQSPSSVTPLVPMGPPPPPGQGYPSPYPPMVAVPSTPLPGYSNPGLASSGPMLTQTPGYLSPQPPSSNRPRRKTGLYVTLVLLLLLVLIGGATFVFLRPFGPSSPIASNGIGAEKVNGEAVGISDGSYAFDITREDGSAKQQAADALKDALSKKSKNYDLVISHLNEALKLNGNDAEALIYRENMQVLRSGAPYITLVVATMLTGSNDAWVGTGRDNLQGVYVAQKDFNDGAMLKNGLRIRILIANSGSNDQNVERVAQQIIKAAQADPTIIGVMGWPHSAQAQTAYKILSNAHIPMVSPTASDDGLTGVSPYFFRVAPSNHHQANQAANYARNTLHATSVAVFYDPQNAYTASLGQDFMQAFKEQGGQVVAEEKYTVQQTGPLPGLLQDALAKRPDLIYFAGYSSDISVLLSNSLPKDLPVLGGDALYQLNGYSQGAHATGFQHLNFTAFAYPDEWDVLGYRDQKPSFFAKYPAYFNADGKKSGGTYGYTRPANDVILSYDATLALLHATNLALTGSKTSLTPLELRDALSKLNGENAFQGVSGQIAFGSDGDPVDKAIVILHVSPEGYIQMDSHVQGKFLLGS